VARGPAAFAPIDFRRGLAARSHADDERNPPETGIMEHEMKRVKAPAST
jgi:hypothetical protein